MTLHKQILDEAVEAMRAKNELKLNVLKGIKTAFTNELIAKNSIDPELSDDEALKIIKKLVKQRKESIESFKNGGRPELAEQEEAELEILKVYLPPEISRDEIVKIAEAKKAELGIVDKSKLGILIGVVMKELKGGADGGAVKEVVESLFN